MKTKSSLLHPIPFLGRFALIVVALYLCGYENTFIWTIISVSEILSIWSGAGIYAIHTNNYPLAYDVCVGRTMTLLFARIPWWLMTLCCLKYIQYSSVFIWYVIGIKLIICLDIYWLSECLKKLIIYHLGKD